ncbi:MAG: hypothetical protein ABI675_13320 [Chitinophagaceae bacterium]
MSTLELFQTPSHSVTQEAEAVELNKQASFEYFISTSSYLRDVYQNSLKDYFDSLKYLWLEETKFSSNVFLTANHPAHLAILQLGEQVLPLLIEELQENNNHWFITLNKITGVNPVAAEHAGDVELMKNDWITWAQDNNII